MKTILTIMGFTIANFVYQLLLGERGWESAFKVSFYQSAAIIYCWHIAC